MSAVEYALIPIDPFRDTLEDIRVGDLGLDETSMAHQLGIDPEKYQQLEKIRSRYELDPPVRPTLKELQSWPVPQNLTARLVKAAGYDTNKP